MPFPYNPTWRRALALAALLVLLAPPGHAADEAQSEGESSPSWWLQHWERGPAGSAPAGVRGVRVLAKGEWELSYRFSHDRFEDLRSGIFWVGLIASMEMS